MVSAFLVGFGWMCFSSWMQKLKLLSSSTTTSRTSNKMASGNLVPSRKCWMNRALGLLLLTFYVKTSSAALEIPGVEIDGTTVTWSADDNPITVSGPVNINQNGVLVILDGAHVTFTVEEAGLFNHLGKLLILGEPNRRVTLTAPPDDNSYWRGIYTSGSALSATFTETPDDDLDFDDGSVIQFTDIVRAGSLNHIPVQFYRGAPYLLGVDLVECQEADSFVLRMWDLQSYFVAKNLRLVSKQENSTYAPTNAIQIQGSGGNGIAMLDHFETTVPCQTLSAKLQSLSRAILKDCHLEGGVDMNSIQEVTIVQNYIEATTSGVTPLRATHVGSDQAGRRPINITDNEILSYPGDRHNAFYAYRWDSTVEQSYIAGNQIRGSLNYDGYYGHDNKLTISNNVIRDSSYGGLAIIGGGVAEGDFVVQNNTIYNSHSTSTVVFFRARGNAFAFIGNTVTDSSGNTVIHYDGAASIATSIRFEENLFANCTGNYNFLYISNYPFSSFQRNLFVNSTAPNSVIVPSEDSRFTTDVVFSLPMNYWGAFQDDIRDLRMTVQDGFKYSNGPIIDFASYLVEPSFTSDVELVELPGLYLSDGAVGGYLQNGNFTLASAEFVCNLTIIVSDGATLLIEEGVSVAFAPSRGIIVHPNGRIIAQGKAGLPLSLGPVDPVASTWAGVSLNSALANVLSHTTIEKADIGVNHVGTGELFLDHVNISSVRRGIEHTGSGSLDVQTSFFADTLEHGIFSSFYGRYRYDYEGSVLLSDSTFVNCGEWCAFVEKRISFSVSNGTVHGGQHGIGAGMRVETLLMTNCHVENVGGWGMLVNNGVASSGTTVGVLGNTILRSVGGIHLRCESYCTVNMANNSIVGNRETWTSSQSLFLDVNYAQRVRIEDNVVESWNITGVAAVKLDYDANAFQGETGLEFTGNVFRDIIAPNIIEILYKSTHMASNIQGVFGQNLEVTSESEPAFVVLRNWPSGDNGLSLASLIGNIFMTPLPAGTYYVQLVESIENVPLINASRCFWNTQDVLVLLDRIYDGTDSAQYSTLHYNPFLLVPDPAGPTKTAIPPFLRSGNILSGRLVEGENVTLESGVYFSQGSLFVDGVLVVEPGVVIRMEAGTSILVEKGGLLVKGTIETPVRIEGLGGARWGQLKVKTVSDPSNAVELLNVAVSDAGAGSIPALDLQRPGTFVNISVFDCIGGGLAVSSTGGSFVFDGLHLVNTVSGTSLSNLVLSGSGSPNVTLRGIFLSSTGSSELHALQSVRLVVDQIELQPRYSNTYGLRLENSFSYIDSLVFNATFLPENHYGRPLHVYATHLQSFSLLNSRFDDDGRRSNDVYVLGSSTSSIVMQNNVHLGSRVNYGFVELEEVGTVFLNENIFSNSSSTGGAVSIDAAAAAYLRNNSASDIVCSQSCFLLKATNLSVESNQFKNVDVLSPASLIEFESEAPRLVGNRLESCVGHIAFSIIRAPSEFNFTRNSVENSTSLIYYMRTATQFDEVEGGVYFIDANYWGTTDFQILRQKTFDSAKNLELASVVYSGLFADEDFTILVNAPPPGSIFDPETRQISGTIFSGIAVQVPSGLYYAPSSIIVQHPDAILFFQGGVRIMFAPNAGIRVSQGVFQALGTSAAPVELTSTDQLSTEYGDGTLRLSDRWQGIWITHEATKTVVDDITYVAGSLLRHLKITNGGYSSRNSAVRFDQASIMMEHVVVNKSGNDGVTATSLEGYLVMKHVHVLDATDYGIYAYNSDARLDNVNIAGSGRAGAYLYNHNDVIISNSHFRSNCLSCSSSYSETQISSRGGQGFFNISSSKISDASNYGIYISNDFFGNRHAGLKSNIIGVNFTNLRVPLLNTVGWKDWRNTMSVSMSKFVSNNCGGRECIHLASYQPIQFYRNEIEDNIANSIVQIHAYQGSTQKVDVAGNIFRGNMASSSSSGEYAVLSLSSDGLSQWEAHGNEFADPNSQYEITTSRFSGSPGQMKVNATKNLFSFLDNANEASIDARIYDDEENENKPKVTFVPFISSNYTPECDLNCSGQGRCVFPGYCICEDGWTGSVCDRPSCQSLDFCRHGECVDFDVCECHAGWLGASCSAASCSERNECMGHGECRVPHVCTCDLGYTGVNCEFCVDNYRRVGQACVPCSPCKNAGICGPLAECICVENFAGPLCSECKHGFFGPNCEPTPFIETVTPNDAVAAGGVTIRVAGLNFGLVFNSSDTFTCQFSDGGSAVATLVEDNVLECKTPQVELVNSGIKYTSLHITLNGETSYNDVGFTFYGLCPPNECLNGFCSFGRCQCYYGWAGESCEVKLVAPVVSVPSGEFEVTEGHPFKYQFLLQEGTTPVEWVLSGGSRPEGMNLNSATGHLEYLSPVASFNSYVVRAQAQNEFGHGSTELRINVTPSYMVRVSTFVLDFSRPSPSFPFQIETVDIETFELIGDKLAVLWIREENAAARRKITVMTGTDGKYTRSYQPYASDVGRFLYGGEHPDYDDTTVQGAINIRGIDVSPSSHHLTGLVGKNYTLADLFQFTFFGGTFSGLKVEVESLHGFAISVSLNASSADATSVITASVELLSEEVVRETIFFVIRSDEEVVTRFIVIVDIRNRTPALRTSQSTIELDVARNGEARYVDVVIENIGSNSSSEIAVKFPNQPVLRSLAGNTIPGLSVNEKRTVTFAFVAPPDYNLGYRFWGSISFETAESSAARVSYQVTIVSTVPTSLTIVTENEGTFFAEGKPNLANVSVSVRSLTNGASQTLSSGPGGNVTFPDLVEDLYEIYCQKLKHAPFKTTVFLEAPGQTIYAFLQADVVSYTFTVIPVEIVESYIIEIETTFETFVPKPIVIWDPAVLDYDAIRYGYLDELQLTATNYGLIEAENVTLTWTRYWENVEFILSSAVNEDQQGNSITIELGNLPANSSLSVSIEIRRIIDVPGDQVIRRLGDYIALYPKGTDPSWRTGPKGVLIRYADPADRVVVQFFPGGRVDYAFFHAHSTLLTWIYNETGLVEIVILENATLPESGRRLGVESSAVALSDHMERRKLHCHEPWYKTILKDFDPVTGFVEAFKAAGHLILGLISLTVESGTIGLSIWAIVCRGSRELAHTWANIGASDDGDGGGGGDDSCDSGDPYDGGDGGPGLGGHDNRCFEQRYARSTSRKLQIEDCSTECSRGELKLAFQAIKSRELDLLGAESKLNICANEAQSSDGIKSIFPCVLKQALDILPTIPLASKVVSCILRNRPCYGDLSNKPGLLNLLIQSGRFQSMLRLILLVYGGRLSGVPASIYTNGTDLLNRTQLENFGTGIVDGLSDTSEQGRAFSPSELNELLNVGFDLPNEADIRYFADTWNRSLLLWDEDVISSNDLPENYSYGFFDLSAAASLIEEFQEDRLAVRNEGFSGFSDAFLKAVEGQQFEEARILAGICANVRIRISQELTMTRVGFEAQLEISNDLSSPLEGLSVSLRVNPFLNYSEDATDVFVIGAPDLYKISSIEGNGTLAGRTKGLVTWLMLPLTEAAPQFDTRYDVSGILVYRIDGIEYVQNLAPDTITVKPDPQLYLTYFMSRTVYSDDPFSVELEPALPFHLGLLIENRGYGDAKNLKIASSQPVILQNDKGLLVDFSIIGSRFGNRPVANTLNIEFGDIYAQSNIIGVWDLVSTVRGNFYNFTARFQYNGPIDDGRLSLIESVEIYELNHLVRMTGEHPRMENSFGYYTDDGLDDFLVNRNPDAFYYPDTVFTSDTRSRNFSVSHVIDQAGFSEPQHNVSNGRVFVEVHHTNLTNEARSQLHEWVYIRFDDPMKGTDYLLRSATRTDLNYTLIEQANSWQTTWTEYLKDGGIEEQNFIHLFDFGIAETYILEFALQPPVSNVRILESTNTSFIVAWDPAVGATSSFVLIKPSIMDDQYYRVVYEFIQRTSCRIDYLTEGTQYTIKVFTGDHGNYERIGATVNGRTTGVNRCGNGIVDPGEDCDDGGDSNGFETSNCTIACVARHKNDTGFEIPTSDVPSVNPSASTEPSSSPSLVPTASLVPSISPSTNPTSSIEPSNVPSSHPSLRPSPLASEEPTSIPSSEPSASAMPSASEEPTNVASFHPSMRGSEPPSPNPTQAPTGPGICPARDACEHSPDGAITRYTLHRDFNLILFQFCRSACVRRTMVRLFMRLRRFKCGKCGRNGSRDDSDADSRGNVFDREDMSQEEQNEAVDKTSTGSNIFDLHFMN